MIRSTSTTLLPNPGPTTSIVEFAAQRAPHYDFYRLSVPVPNASGFSSAQAALEQIGRLKANWDGYGALAVASDACAHAQGFLAVPPLGMLVPEVNPTSNGTVSLEWSSSEGDAYLEIGRTRYSGHIQTQRGRTFYLEGRLTNPLEQNLATEQVLAVIKELVYGSSFSKSLTHTIQIIEPVV